ncbi:MAG: glycosyltransferase family 4 protein [Bacteriovoracaceae bacterium]|nr:glycosyltransferase family 4 protein [Bacteriovoracaceae bacterium]
MKKLRILMCCQFPIKADLGGPKGYIEIAETYRQRGHEVTLVGINQIVGDETIEYHEAWRLRHFAPYLKDYILANHHNYDVIEYEAVYLPYNLKDQVKSILVARSVLLELHFKKIKLPVLKTLRAYVSHVVKFKKRSQQLNQRINTFLTAMKYSDVVNVSNPDDKEILIQYGVDPNKIVMQPYGISLERFNEFQIDKNENSNITIAFVGSFDRRKGAVEFPAIVKELSKSYPQIKFKLLGVLGLFRSVESIYKYFGNDLSDNVEVIARYNPKDLPRLLSECHLGIFPSHLESFGFGVLEMMAASLPVVGYSAPGTSMLLPKDLLVARGDYKAMIKKIKILLENNDERLRLSLACNRLAREYIYENQENASLEKYNQLINSI